jgi:phosphoglycolate phosphatase-like HAD superfamily hydrolase
LKRLGATPSTTVIVGDTINDVLAAKAVPMKVVAVASPYGGREKVIGAQPDYFIESVADLVETLESHNAAVVRRT